MTEPHPRVFAPHCDEELRLWLCTGLGVELESNSSESPVAGDVVILDAEAAAELNAFSRCRVLKREPLVRVFIVLRMGDVFGEEVARFCMADGVLRRGAESIAGLERVRLDDVSASRTRPSLDRLLDRYESRLQEDPERVASALQRLEAEIDTGSVASRFSDPETGLFDAAFAGFKLDEELKRALRFHQPLALMLLDCGIEHWPSDEGERRTVLAEVASVFLEECRDIDVLARFTPTVFLFLLPGTGPDGAMVVARRMVASLAERELSASVRLAPRVGIATAPHPRVRDRRSFVSRAEKALESAGRTSERVAVAGSD